MMTNTTLQHDFVNASEKFQDPEWDGDSRARTNRTT